ncbi:MAG: glycosyltransferase family 39 protein [Elusimicrobia bacterium]|nr:glycosyltransferase family 39 protein [Elusimicrobiota bacterium]
MKSWLKRPELVVSGLLLAGLGLRSAWLMSQSMWSDEALTLVVSQAGDLWGLMRGLESSPPLHFLLMRPWLKAFADPLLGMRLFSLACGSACLWAFFKLAKEVVPEAAVSSLFIAVFSSYWVHASQDGRFYSLFLLLSILQTSVLWRLREKDDLKLWLLYVALASLGLYTHYFMLFLVLAGGAYTAASRLLCRRPIHLTLASFAGIAVLYLPWLGFLSAQARLREGATLVVERLDLPQLAFILGTMLCDLNFLGLVLIPWIKGLGCLVLGALVLAGAVMAKDPGPAKGILSRWTEGRVFCLAHIVLGLALFPLVHALAGIPLVQPRYFVWLSPFVYMLLAVLVTGTDLSRAVARLALTLVLITGLGGYLASNRAFDPRLGALSLQAKLSGPGLPVIHLHPYYYLPLRYYYMPEAEHRLIPSHRKDLLDLENLPGYPGIQRLEDLGRTGRCLVVDPERRLSPSRVRPSTGRELAGLLDKSGSKEP